MRQTRTLASRATACVLSLLEMWNCCNRQTLVAMQLFTVALRVPYSRRHDLELP